MTFCKLVEQWRSIPTYEGYLASNKGRIMGRLGKIMNGTIVKNGAAKGYRVVCVRCEDGEYRPKMNHRLVCLAFHGEPIDGQQVAHNDGDKTNNHPDNLRWATAKENHADAIKHGTHQSLHNYGENQGGSKLTEKQVLEILAAPRHYGMQIELAEKYGVTNYCISKIVSGKRWAHLGAR